MSRTRPSVIQNTNEKTSTNKHSADCNASTLSGGMIRKRFMNRESRLFLDLSNLLSRKSYVILQVQDGFFVYIPQAFAVFSFLLCFWTDLWTKLMRCSEKLDEGFAAKKTTFQSWTALLQSIFGFLAPATGKENLKMALLKTKALIKPLNKKRTTPI